MNRIRHGFTLIELLVVIAIIAALLAILMPSMRQAVFLANEAVCGSNIRQVIAAHQSYAASSFGQFYPNNQGHHHYARYGVSVTAGSVFRAMAVEGKYLPEPDIMVCPLLDGGESYNGYASMTDGSLCNWRYAMENPTANEAVWSGYGWMGNMTMMSGAFWGYEPDGVTTIPSNSPKFNAVMPTRMADCTGSNTLMTHRMIVWAGGANMTDHSHGGAGVVLGIGGPYFKSVRNPVGYGDGHVGFNANKDFRLRLADNNGQRPWYW